MPSLREHSRTHGQLRKRRPDSKTTSCPNLWMLGRCSLVQAGADRSIQTANKPMKIRLRGSDNKMLYLLDCTYESHS